MKSIFYSKGVTSSSKMKTIKNTRKTPFKVRIFQFSKKFFFSLKSSSPTSQRHELKMLIFKEKIYGREDMTSSYLGEWQSGTAIPVSNRPFGPKL